MELTEAHVGLYVRNITAALAINGMNVRIKVYSIYIEEITSESALIEIELHIFSNSLLLAPNPKGLGAYNLVSVRTYVRPYVLPWTAISQKCMDQIV